MKLHFVPLGLVIAVSLAFSSAFASAAKPIKLTVDGVDFVTHYSTVGTGTLMVKRGKDVLFKVSGGKFTPGVGESATAAEAKVAVNAGLIENAKLVLFTEWTGGNSCCFVVHAFSVTKREVSQVGVPPLPGEAVEFKDLNGDGKPELVFWVNPLQCRFTSCADDPGMSVALEWRAGWKSFVPAPELLHHSIPGTRDIDALGKSWSARLKATSETERGARREFLKLLCDWIAAGHFAEAMDLADRAFKGHPDFGDGRVQKQLREYLSRFGVGIAAA